jgi:hypothetical protein
MFLLRWIRGIEPPMRGIRTDDSATQGRAQKAFAVLAIALPAVVLGGLRAREVPLGQVLRLCDAIEHVSAKAVRTGCGASTSSSPSFMETPQTGEDVEVFSCRRKR